MVRSFPGDNRRRALMAIVACLVAALALAVPLASANDDLKDRQRQVKKQIGSASSELHESSAAMRAAAARLDQAKAELGRAQSRLARTRGQLAAARVRDREMQAKLDEAVADLNAARGELAAGRADVETQRAAVGDMVADIYELGDPRIQSVASLLDAADPGDMTRSLAATDAVVDEENATLDELTAAEVLLTVAEEKVERQKDVVEVRRQAAAENLALRKRLEARAQEAAAAVKVLVGRRADAFASARRARAKDEAVLSRLKAQDARISAALRRRAAALAAKAAKAAQGSVGSRDSGGVLRHPVDGYVTSPFGYRTHPIYKYFSLHDGTDFGASAGCGTPLLAATSGRVMSRYYQSAYGNRLVIDHGLRRGVGLATIYNHAARYVVSPGQSVSRGQVVGYMGNTGWSTGCHLHFTVMANGRPVNPANWF
ncbi:peptidoglycan DD-metalloendopeptidase family protein [Nocardioides donggukensis]|uniref:Peptidoglycan DD-metalloendopeptidase family protein n=1 Tax=Nocardioides donggukensis TaxID=2774019 RepID=A0A927K4I9_9ACTN|nr:M23 family metallopeptidase [Nocardioides donggukensis]MBD8868778.1 peptidoglycan DD-metalloendopeptidase family protein [Nocardioides donggukensis]